MLDGISVEQRQWKEGKPFIILLHGLLGSYRNWTSLIEQLDEKYNIINCKLSGHEENYDINDKKNTSIAGFAENLKAYLEDHDIKKVDVIGHSLGGLIGLELAKTADLINKIILVNVATKQMAKEGSKPRIIKIIEKQPTAFIKKHFKKMFLNKLFYKECFNRLIINEEAYKKYMIDILNIDYSDFHEYISKQNVYVFLSLKIFAKRKRKLDRILERYGYHVLNSSKIKISYNGGSFIMNEQPERFNNYIESILL